MYGKRQPWRGSVPVIAIPLFFLSCGAANAGNIVGGGCSYTETSGQATVLSLNAAGAAQNNCGKDPVEVVVNFAPSDPVQANEATDKNVQVTVGDGKNPPRGYITSKGFAVGATIACSRKIIKSGACTPILYEFPGIDLTDYVTSCN
jgi:hypothetical protein